MPSKDNPCPCGSGKTFDQCCGPLHSGQAQADSPEALMRSRYSAYALANADYLLRTWHPKTRPSQLQIDPKQRWLGLKIKRVEQGEQEGRVEFVARYKIDGRGSRLHEDSRFEQLNGRWLYVDGNLV